MRATVEWEDSRIFARDAQKVCGWVLAGVAYVEGFVAHDRIPPINYRLVLAYIGHGIERHSLTWWPLGTLSPEYASTWFPQDEDRTRSYVVMTFAHEATHLFASLLNIADPHNEEIAYTAGACALLVQTGAIRQDAVLNAPLQSEGEVTKAAFASNTAAINLGKTLSPYFADGAKILLKSPSGKHIENRCESRLKGFFGERP